MLTNRQHLRPYIHHGGRPPAASWCTAREGTTTTPCTRMPYTFRIPVIDVIDRAESPGRATACAVKMATLTEAVNTPGEHGDDIPEVRDWLLVWCPRRRR